MKKAYNWRDLSLLLSHYMHHWVCRKAWALPLLRSSLIITYKGCAVMGSRYSTLLIWQPEKTILLIPKLDPSFQHHKNELKRGRKKKKKSCMKSRTNQNLFSPRICFPHAPFPHLQLFSPVSLESLPSAILNASSSTASYPVPCHSCTCVRSSCLWLGDPTFLCKISNNLISLICPFLFQIGQSLANNIQRY